MAGYVPGQQPANRSQEKEFVQAYEDVLERYKDERDRVQKKTFTKWVNKHLMKVGFVYVFLYMWKPKLDVQLIFFPFYSLRQSSLVKLVLLASLL